MRSPETLVVSNDAPFVRAIVNCWQSAGDMPRLTVASRQVCAASNVLNFPLVILGPVRDAMTSADCVLSPLQPNVCVVVDPSLFSTFRESHPEWTVIAEQFGWPEMLLCVAREMSRRMAAEHRAEEAARSDMVRKRLAALGGEIVEAHPALVNALTSLLGNADLLLLENQPLSAEGAEQARSIHVMALRLNEIMQRMFSQASEIAMSARESQSDTNETRLRERGLHPEALSSQKWR